MTQRTLVKGAEEALGTNAGAAKTFSGATVVRLVNTATGADHLVDSCICSKWQHCRILYITKRHCRVLGEKSRTSGVCCPMLL